MDLVAFLASDWYSYVLLPVLIFVFRIMDVSLGTMRVIFISKGFRLLAPLLGFFEVMIWLFAIENIMSAMGNPLYVIAYAGGFASGTYTGMLIEEKLSVGKVMIRVITGRDATSLLKKLRENRYTMTVAGADGPEGKVQHIMMIIKRQHTKQVMKIIRDFHPETFFVIEDVKYASEEHTPPTFTKRVTNLFGHYRKGK
jgi:uncharacterized protein YebE (UPF0316 family)